MIRRLSLFAIIILLILGSFAVNLAQDDAMEITIFRDENSLTVFVPEGQSGSLTGVTLVSTISGNSVGYGLDDANLAGFSGFAFNSVEGPVCLRFIRNSAAVTPPTVCDAQRTNTQPLSDADVFWFDSFSRIGRLVSVIRGNEVLGECSGGQPQCVISIPQNEFIDTFDGPVLSGVWNTDMLDPSFFEISDGRLHITAVNNTDRWQQWAIFLEIGRPYASAEADFELVSAQGGEVGLGISGTTTNNNHCFHYSLWTDTSRYDPGEGFALSAAGTAPPDDPAACWDLVEEVTHPDFPLGEPYNLEISLTGSIIDFSRDGQTLRPAIPEGTDNLGNLLMIRIQLDAGASMEGYVDNFRVMYSTGETVVTPTPSLTPEAIDDVTSPTPTTNLCEDTSLTEVTITAPQNARVRSGPGQGYTSHAILEAGTTVPVVCRDVSGQWIYLEFGHWVGVSVVQVTGDVNNLLIYEPPSPVVVASFDNCSNINENDLGGGNGVFRSNGSGLNAEAIPDPNNPDGCNLRLSSNLVENGFAGYWMQILGADYGPYSDVCFEARADVATSVKFELKNGPDVYLQSSRYSISTEWATYCTSIDAEIERILELVFVFEEAPSGSNVTMYVDNVRFEIDE